MTEAKWLATTDPWGMLRFLERRVSDRKMRLLTISAAHLLAPQIVPQVMREAVSVAERYADGAVDGSQLSEFLSWFYRLFSRQVPEQDRLLWDASSQHDKEFFVAVFAMSFPGSLFLGGSWAGTVTKLAKRLVPSIRDIFGNPFRPVIVDPAWLTSAVVGLAEGTYADRAFDRLPVLADALQDAGCEHADILAHCREPGDHVRGCWVVDLLTGRT